MNDTVVLVMNDTVLQVMNDTVLRNLELVQFAESRQNKSSMLAGHLANLTTTRLQSIIGLIDVIYGGYRAVMQEVQVCVRVCACVCVCVRVCVSTRRTI